MPAKNIIKTYVPGGIYHIYNRGVDKMKTFVEPEDYFVFLWLLKKYLSPPELYLPNKNPKPTLYEKAELFQFALMPNHYHLLLKQITVESMTALQRRVNSSYSGYFNRKYERLGPLNQGSYKASMIKNDEHLLQISKYIHTNPIEILEPGQTLESYEYSSFPYYLGLKNAQWINTSKILSYFESPEDYKKFILG